MRGSSRSQHIFAKKINDDLLVEIFDFCRLDNISPNTYPRNWWCTLAHVCQRWRRVLFATPTRLGITLVCNSRTPVADLLANSPPLPLVVYWGNPGTLDTDRSVKGVRLALDHRDRVRRLTVNMPESSLKEVFSLMDGPLPMLETLQVYCLDERYSHSPAALPSMFEAPNLRHFQISDLRLLPPSTQLLNNATTRPSIVSFTLGEITIKPTTLMTCLASMPHLKVLKIGVSFHIPSSLTERAESRLLEGPQAESDSLALTELEEFEYQGNSEYLETLAAHISAPFLKKLSITFSNKVEDSANLDTTTFKYLSQLISGAADLAFRFARVRAKDGFSIVMNHDELWTGRGAFELRFNHRDHYFDADIGFMANICRALAPMPSIVQSLLVEDAHRNKWMRKPKHKDWRALFRVFDNIKTLRVAGRFVEELDEALKSDKNGGLATDQTLLPRLEEVVRYGPENEFAALVQARQVAGSLPVRVVSGPENRLTLF